MIFSGLQSRVISSPLCLWRYQRSLLNVQQSFDSVRSLNKGKWFSNGKKESEMTFTAKSDKFQLKSSQPELARNNSFFDSPKRRKTFVAIVTFGVVAYGVKMLVHSYLQDHIQAILQHYRPDGKQTRLSEEMIDLIRSVMEDIQLEPTKMEKVRIFINSSDETTTHLGAYNLYSGVLIGLPHMVNYTRIEDVPIKKLTVRSKLLTPDQLGSPEVQNLQQSLVLSKNGKKFLIARELFRGQKSSVLAEALVPLWLFPSLYICYLMFYKKIKLSTAPFLVRLFLGSLTFSLSICTYCALNNVRNDILESKLDKTVSEVSPDYAKGGVELYDKTLRRHLATKDLLPDDVAKSTYNVLGEFHQPLFWNKERPILKRKKDCEKIFQEFISAN